MFNFGNFGDWEFPVPNPKDNDEDRDTVGQHYFRCEMTKSQRLLILDAVRRFETSSTALKRSAEQAVSLAEQMPGSIKDRIDWAKAEKLLEKWGPCWSLADLIAEEPKK